MQRGKIGIDEAGRGPIAGPVSVAVFQSKVERQKLKAIGMKLRDSKKLTPLQREAWFTQIKVWKREGKCDFAVTLISAKVIDRIGISKTIRLAISRCLFKLQPSTSNLILLDGALHAPKHFKNQNTIIKGDEKISVISLASIVAKVHRDRYMVRLAKKFPNYDFDTHKGYGTRGHYRKIKMHGLSPVHRRSFLRGFGEEHST